jgi:hypothetical protein
MSVAMTAAACERGAESDRSGAPADTATAPEIRAMTEGLAVWRADGFTMLVPDDADVVPTDPDAPATWAVIVAGPGFVREVDGLRQPGPPAYRLDAATYAKADTLDLEEWVAARLAERGESGGDAGITVAVAGEPALRTNGKVVELRLEEEPESPLSGIQRHIQSLMLSTFRWSGETEASVESAD